MALKLRPIMCCAYCHLKAFYDQHQAPATFVGHPLADTLPILDTAPEAVEQSQSAARRELGLVEHRRVVGLLPGSRAGEIARLAPIYLRAAVLLHKNNPTIQFVTPMVSTARRDQFQALAQAIAPDLPLTIVGGRAHTVMQASDAIIVTSGTVTLEAMLLGTPMVVAYNFSWLSFQLIRRLFKAPFFSLPNLLAQRELVRELVQDDVTPAALMAQIQLLLDQEQTQLRNEFRQLHASIQQNASASGAQVICDILQDNSN